MNAFIITVVNLFWILLLVLMTYSAQATVSLNADCPTKFIGRVEKVFTPKSPQNHLLKEKVYFSVLETIEGDYKSERIISLLKYGPIKFKQGKSYHISMNGMYLCSSKRVE